MNNGDHENSDFIYELTKENKTLILEIEDLQNKMNKLKLHLVEIEKSHDESVLQLKQAKEYIKQLTAKLEDANNIKWQYSGQDRRKVDMPYPGQERRQFNFAAMQH